MITTPLITASILISLVGIMANCQSLSYFLKRQTKGLGNRLLMLLNTCDLVVCVVYVPRAVMEGVYIHHSVGIGYIVINIIYCICFDCTGFSTCLVSVTRTIKVCRPFYSLKGVWIAASFVLYSICSTVREISGNCYYWSNEKTYFVTNYIPSTYHLTIFTSMTSCNVTAVFISTVITAYWLLRKSQVEGNISKSNHHATITILILSTVFCLLNVTAIVYLAFVLLGDFRVIHENGTISTSKALLYQIAWNVMICLNSTVNPIIYLTRKEEMRRHVLEIWRSLVDRFRAKSEGTGLQIIGLKETGRQESRPQEY